MTITRKGNKRHKHRKGEKKLSLFGDIILYVRNLKVLQTKYWN